MDSIAIIFSRKEMKAGRQRAIQSLCAIICWLMICLTAIKDIQEGSSR